MIRVANRPAAALNLSDGQRLTLQKLSRSQTAPQRQVLRAKSLLMAADGELELELGRERRAAAREARRARGQSIGRPKALDKPKAALAQRMHASGESARTIAATLGVSRATVYRVLAWQNHEAD